MSRKLAWHHSRKTQSGKDPETSSGRPTMSRLVGNGGVTKSPVIADEAPERPFQYIRETKHETWSLSPFHGNSERLQALDLTRFLHANRYPLRSKTL